MKQAPAEKKKEDKKAIHRRETDGKTEFQRRRSAKGIFFCVYLERMGASYTARSVNLAWAAASSRLPSGVLS